MPPRPLSGGAFVSRIHYRHRPSAACLPANDHYRGGSSSLLRRRRCYSSTQRPPEDKDKDKEQETEQEQEKETEQEQTAAAATPGAAVRFAAFMDALQGRCWWRRRR